MIFIVPYPIEGPSSRLRVWQYLKYLEKLGINWCFRPFMSSAFYKIVYQPGHFGLKTYHFIICAFNRFLDLIRIKKYDLVFVQREAFPFGPPIFEWIVTKILGKPLIYDFDDAIFLKTKSQYNNLVQFLKSPQKVSKIIQMSTHVIVGNKYLQEYALEFNRNVTIIPTPVDTEEFKSGVKNAKKGNVVLGWIGSHSTTPYLLPLKNVFQRLKKEHSNLTVKLIGAESIADELPATQCLKWALEDELRDLRSFDIGIMPVPDNAWARGKCALKILQYMAIGIPVVCSPVGVNKEIVKNGVNGFWAASEEEWYERLQMLIENPELRRTIGLRARATVETSYSVKACLPILTKILRRTGERVR